MRIFINSNFGFIEKYANMSEKIGATKTTEKNYDDVVLNFLNQFVNLTKEEEQVILDNMHPEYFEKGSFLIKEGQIPQTCYFILKGCVRQFYLKDGEERTTNFYTSKGILSGTVFINSIGTIQ